MELAVGDIVQSQVGWIGEDRLKQLYHDIGSIVTTLTVKDRSVATNQTFQLTGNQQNTHKARLTVNPRSLFYSVA